MLILSARLGNQFKYNGMANSEMQMCKWKYGVRVECVEAATPLLKIQYAIIDSTTAYYISHNQIPQSCILLL